MSLIVIIMMIIVMVMVWGGLIVVIVNFVWYLEVVELELVLFVEF